MIPDVHSAEVSMYSIKLGLGLYTRQVQAYVLVMPEGHWSTYQEAFIILVNALTFIEDKANICRREKS